MSIWKAVSVAGALIVPLVLSAPAAADNKTVILSDASFSPKEANISPGDSVTWRHRDDDTPHSVTFEDGYDPYQGCSEPDILNSCMEEGDSTQRTFLVVGTFRYYCRIHQRAGMTGVVNVLGPTGSNSTTSTTRPTPGSGPGGAASSSSSSSTATTAELVVSTSTTRPAVVASLPPTTARPALVTAPTAPRAPAPPLNPDARSNEEQLAALPTEGDGGSGDTDGGDSGGGALGVLGGLAVAVLGAAGVLVWKFRPRGRIA